MPVVTATLALIIFAAGTVAGSLGALLGLGGGVFLVPFLNLVLGFRFNAAAAISLTTVIATSSTVSAGRAEAVGSVLRVDRALVGRGSGGAAVVKREVPEHAALVVPALGDERSERES